MSDPLVTQKKLISPVEVLRRRFQPLQPTVASLWTHLADSSVRPEHPDRILVTAVDGDSGATTIACCTALCLVQYLGAPTVLVDADPEGHIDQLFETPVTPGLKEALDGSYRLDQSVHATPLEGLSVLPVGRSKTQLSTLLAGPEGDKLFPALLEDYRFVVVDAPPLSEFPEARLLLRYVDAVLLVLTAGKTTKESASRAIESVKRSGAELMGTILNRYKRELPRWLLPSKWD